MSTTRGCSILQHGCPRLDTSIESNRFDIITTGVKDGGKFSFPATNSLLDTNDCRK